MKLEIFCKCGEALTQKRLDPLEKNSGKFWLGCQNCGLVVEVQHTTSCGLPAVSIGECSLSYQDYMNILQKDSNGWDELLNQEKASTSPYDETFFLDYYKPGEMTIGSHPNADEIVPTQLLKLGNSKKRRGKHKRNLHALHRNTMSFYTDKIIF